MAATNNRSKEASGSNEATNVSGTVPILANDVTKWPILKKNTKGPVSFAKLVTDEPSRKKINLHTLLALSGNGADVTISLESVRVVSERFANSLYYFFSGKHTPDVNLLKKDVCNVSDWVKFHDVPIMAFSEDGLSAIATKLVTILMLNSYTPVMCIESWGIFHAGFTLVDGGEFVQDPNIVTTLLPQIRAEIREEFRTSSGPAAAGTEEEQEKNLKWGLRRSTLNHLMCMSYTDVAQVANAARGHVSVLFFTLV
nr:hypothetical protein [Tanacetum cinerariifolium]